MRKTRAGRQFAETELVEFLDRRIGDWKGRKTQAEIAAEAGFQSANMMSMIRTGATRLPLDRVRHWPRPSNPARLIAHECYRDWKFTASPLSLHDHIKLE